MEYKIAAIILALLLFMGLTLGQTIIKSRTDQHNPQDVNVRLALDGYEIGDQFVVTGTLPTPFNEAIRSANREGWKVVHLSTTYNGRGNTTFKSVTYTVVLEKIK